VQLPCTHESSYVRLYSNEILSNHIAPWWERERRGPQTPLSSTLQPPCGMVKEH
jgi:hypothetical protein